MLLLSTTFMTSYSCTPFITQPSFNTRTKQAHGFMRVSCNAEDNENQLILPEKQKLILPNNVDRRNLLVGLGGLYTAANITSLPSALALRITTPDITSPEFKCQTAIVKNYKEGSDRTLDCCQPSPGKTIKPFKFPSKLEKTRVRWPAHKGSKKQVDSYKKAIQAIRKLPPDHPHSFVSQAKIHCAYCNDGYPYVDVNGNEQTIHIHSSWLFFPFHRWYLYFYERILRKYSGDDDFALPYWNWDNPEGMTIPPIFVDEKDDNPLFDFKNPLYDKYRNPDHLPPKVVDLFWNGGAQLSNDYVELDSERQKACNLSMVYRDLKSNATTCKSFFGGEYTAGNDPPDSSSAGSVEGNSHTSVHLWVGSLPSPTTPNREDMGNFYSAGYDPLFYVHHANVDRMWKLWKDSRIASEPTADDWLKASYVFYDENENLVRVCNKDSVNIDNLKYAFKESETRWKTSRPAQRKVKSKELLSALGEVKTVKDAFKTGPAHVDPLLKVRVKRPATKRSPEEKDKAKEILCINGIKFMSNKFVKFDVFVNDNVNKDTKKSELPTPCDPEFAGSFGQVPHGNKKGMLMTSAARFGLDELLEDTLCEDEEYALVALVARAGCEDLTVSGIEIKLIPVEPVPA